MGWLVSTVDTSGNTGCGRLSECVFLGRCDFCGWIFLVCAGSELVDIGSSGSHVRAMEPNKVFAVGVVESCKQTAKAQVTCFVDASSAAVLF